VGLILFVWGVDVKSSRRARRATAGAGQEPVVARDARSL
jgi:hypothetical protein